VQSIDLVQMYWNDLSLKGYVDAALFLTDLKAAGKIKAVGKDGTFHVVIVVRQNTVQLMTAGIVVHVTNLTPGGSEHEQPLQSKQRLMTASMFLAM
jgi:hypothetical protein